MRIKVITQYIKETYDTDQKECDLKLENLSPKIWYVIISLKPHYIKYLTSDSITEDILKIYSSNNFNQFYDLPLKTIKRILEIQKSIDLCKLDLLCHPYLLDHADMNINQSINLFSYEFHARLFFENRLSFYRKTFITEDIKMNIDQFIIYLLNSFDHNMIYSVLDKFSASDLLSISYYFIKLESMPRYRIKIAREKLLNRLDDMEYLIDNPFSVQDILWKDPSVEEIYELADLLPLSWIPDYAGHPDVLARWVSHGKGKLQKLHTMYRSENVVTAAVLADPMSLCYVPDALRSFDMCKNAYLRDPKCVKSIPLKFRTDIINGS